MKHLLSKTNIVSSNAAQFFPMKFAFFFEKHLLHFMNPQKPLEIINIDCNMTIDFYLLFFKKKQFTKMNKTGLKKMPKLLSTLK